jgi:hypothetical protein
VVFWIRAVKYVLRFSQDPANGQDGQQQHFGVERLKSRQRSRHLIYTHGHINACGEVVTLNKSCHVMQLLSPTTIPSPEELRCLVKHVLHGDAISSAIRQWLRYVCSGCAQSLGSYLPLSEQKLPHCGVSIGSISSSCSCARCAA